MTPIYRAIRPSNPLLALTDLAIPGRKNRSSEHGQARGTKWAPVPLDRRQCHRPQVYAALAYYEDHREEIDRAFEDETRFLEQFRREHPELQAVELSGTIDFDPRFDYKAERGKR